MGPKNIQIKIFVKIDKTESRKFNNSKVRETFSIFKRWYLVIENQRLKNLLSE